MKEETKQEWIAALRSGKYKQARHALNDGEGGSCCLGVLYEIHYGVRPPVAGHLTGISAKSIGIGYVQQSRCERWNDALEEDFGQIADRIEAGEMGEAL